MSVAIGPSSRSGGTISPALSRHLKAIADAEDQAFLVAEFAQDIAEEVLQLDGEDFSRGDVIAISEAAGNRHNLVLQKEFRIVAQPLNVEAIGDGAGLLEGELRFACRSWRRERARSRRVAEP